MTKRKRNIMEDFSIGEVSAVDFPAQEPAQSKIVKRKGKDTQMVEKFSKEDIPGSIAKKYIDPSEGAMSFVSVLQEELKCQEYYEIMEKVYPYLCSMETSLRSIIGDGSVDKETKLTMMRNTIEDFMTVIRSLWSDADTFMMSALGKMVDEGEGDMAAKKTLADLEKDNAELQTKLDEATKALEAKKSDDTKELEKQLAELQKSVETLTAERDEALAEKAMTDKEKEYMRGMSAKERKAFMQMSGKERKAMMEKAADGDEEVTLKGRTIKKSVVGEDMFEIFKGQAAEMEELRKQAADDRDARDLATLEKSADENYAHLPGTAIEKARVLKSIRDLPDEQHASLIKMLEAGEKAIKGAFSQIGHNNGKVDHSFGKEAEDGGKVAKASFMGKVHEIAKRDGVSKSVAMSKARNEYPDLYREYSGNGN